MLNENRAWVMPILNDSESSKKIDWVINTVETASRLVVHAINILNLSVFRAATGKGVSFILLNFVPIQGLSRCSSLSGIRQRYPSDYLVTGKST